MNNVDLYVQHSDLQKHDTQECLEMFSNKIQRKTGAIAIDVGCGDGFVTAKILEAFLPRCKELVGCDKNEDMVKHASANYSSANTTFLVQDIEDQLPKEMRGKFNFVFSFYALHWVIKPEVAFKNIYDLMTQGGECLLMFLSRNSLFTAYRNLAQNSRWNPWLNDVEKYISHFHDKEEPEKELQRMMYDIGFSYVHVINQPKTFPYANRDSRIKALRAIVPFSIPEDLSNTFMMDLLQENVRIDILERNVEESVAMTTKYYTLLYVYARK